MTSLFVTQALAAAPKTAELDEARAKLGTSLKIFDALVMGSTKTGMVYQVYQTVRLEFLAGKVIFDVDPQERPLLEAVQVVKNGANRRVLLSITLFREDRKVPGMLTGFLAQAIGLLRNASVDNPDDLEKLFHTMDALFYQGRFLKDLDAGRDRKLHPFENYLVSSLDNDSALDLPPMSGASMMLVGFDAQLVASLADLGAAAKAGDIKAGDYLSKIVNLAKRLTEATQQAQDRPGSARMEQELRYVSEVSALTMLRFGVSIVQGHLAAFYPDAPKKETALLADLDKALLELRTIAQKYQSSLTYQKQFLASISL